MKGYKLNPDNLIVAGVREGLHYNMVTYGKPYCPCMLAKNEDTVCQCKDFRETGHCHCGLYVKEDEVEG